MKILIVEDELIPANYLKKVLQKESYEVLNIVTRGADAILLAKEEKPDIILMDVMLKDHISGCDAALEICQENPNILILFLTAFSDKEMIDFAVKSEAFGYLLKPYRDKEILATLELAKAKIAKIKNNVEKDRITGTTSIHLVDEYNYDMENKRLYLHHKEVACGPKAMKLIILLCQNPHRTISIEEILETLWDENPSKQTLRSLIHRIRERTSPNLIINMNKFGYKIGLKE